MKMKMNLFFNIISVLNQSFDFTQSLTKVVSSPRTKLIR